MVRMLSAHIVQQRRGGANKDRNSKTTYTDDGHDNDDHDDEQLVLVRVFELLQKQQRKKSNNDNDDRSNSSIDQSENDVISNWVTTAATLLQNQWPQPPAPAPTTAGAAASVVKDESNDDDDDDAGGVETYRQIILHHNPSRTAYYGLTCSYILLSVRTKKRRQKYDNINPTAAAAAAAAATATSSDKDDINIIDEDMICCPPRHPQQHHHHDNNTSVTVIGHGRLTECFESAGGNAAAATYIIIHPTYRGCGYGTSLMTMLEDESKRLGYHYVYLWTRTAVQFYIQSCGYQPCHRVSLKRACLQSLSVREVQGIEAMLMNRHRRQRQQEQNQQKQPKSQNDIVKQSETLMLLPPGNDDDRKTSHPTLQDDVWLRKRLVEHVGSIDISIDQRLEEVHAFIRKISECCRPRRDVGSSNWYVRWNPSIPYQPQIGPSCGLATLRMVRDYYHNNKNNSDAKAMKKKTIGGVKNEDNDNTTTGQSDGKTSPSSSSTNDSDHHQFPSLLLEAQSRGYTKDGEIFDANNLHRLAVDVCDIPSDHVEMIDLSDIGVVSESSSSSSSLSLSSFISRLDSCIRQSGVAIIPYDSNPRTRSPTKSNGIHAHWGIIVSILYRSNNTTTTTKTETDVPVIKVMSEEEYSDDYTAVIDHSTFVNGEPSSIFLCVQHSLSKEWAIAPLEEWIESNGQLVSVDNDKFSVNDDGLNLRDKIVLVHRT